MEDGQHLIHSLYEAALDPGRWTDFLAHFTVAFSSQAALIWGYDFSDRSARALGGPTSLSAQHGFSEEALRSFEAHYCRVNVWTANERYHVEGQILSGSECYPDNHLTRTEWYADWLQPQDLFYTLAVIVEKRAQRSFNCTAVRSKWQGPYNEREEARMRSLVPHLQTAFALYRRLHRAEALAQTSLAVLENLPMGVVLLDGRAEVLHANARAHALTRATGLLRFEADDTLHAVAPRDDQRLQRAMRDVVATGAGLPLHAGSVLRLHGLAGAQLQLLVAPLPLKAEPFSAHTAGVVFITDPALEIPSLMDILQSLYGMTAAESRLAQALAHGLSLAEYAERQGLSVQTVRTQYKSAAAKAGVGRQSDFVRTLLTGPALLRWARPSE